MAFIMLAILAAFVLIAYFAGKKDLLSPWFLLCLVLLATFCIVLANYSNWEVKINFNFILYITTAVIAFGAGGFLVNALSAKKTAQSAGLNKVYIQDANIPRKYPVNIFLVLSLFCSVLFIYKLLSDAGSEGSFSDKLRRIYDNIVYNDYSPGIVFNQMREMLTAIAYLNTYRLFIKFFLKKDSVSALKLIIPIVLFVASVLVLSDRNIFLRYAIFLICLFVLFFRENYKKPNANLKIVQIVIILVIVMFLVFFLFGRLKQYKSDIFRALGIYGGSGLYDFNLWIENFNEPLMYGKSTFSTFINTLNTIFNYLGFDLGDLVLPDRFDVFIEYTSSNGYVYSSNIYSALKPYVEDFGYFGAIIFPLILGAFYQRLYNKTKRSKYGFGWIIYCMLIYPVIFFPILEQLFRRFSLGFVYELFWICIMYYIAYGKRKNKLNFQSSAKINGVQK